MSTWSANMAERAVIFMLDAHGRNINYMRVSVTDRCNLRCRYCMPEGVDILPMSSLLSFEEITAICRQASLLGINRIKITGGEPLVRRNVSSLLPMLKKIPGIEQVTMTSNGILLGKYLPELKEAGLDAVNISLDTLDADRYRFITGMEGLNQVLLSIDQALAYGIPVKINAVLMHGVNDQDWDSLISLAKERPIDVRFIEIMPIGAGSSFEPVSNDSLLKEMKSRYPEMKADRSVHGNGPAVYYHIPGFVGSIGFISAMHGKFCGSCNRIRMSAIGDIKPCLCYDDSVPVRKILREKGEAAAGEAIRQAIRQKPKAHCFEHQGEITEQKKMIQIGG